ncbi:MAG: hypothetical protein ABI162_01760, partial [Luteolibacter sp.]
FGRGSDVVRTWFGRGSDVVRTWCGEREDSRRNQGRTWSFDSLRRKVSNVLKGQFIPARDEIPGKASPNSSVLKGTPHAGRVDDDIHAV